MNVNQKYQISTLFKEAKWIRNAYLNNKDDVKGNVKEVPIKVGDKERLRKNIDPNEFKQLYNRYLMVR